MDRRIDLELIYTRLFGDTQKSGNARIDSLETEANERTR